MQVSLQYAQEHLEDLASALDRGEEVEIARFEKPSLKLIVSPVPPLPPQTGPRVLGAGVGKMIVPTWEEWKAMDKEIEQEMCDAPLISSGEI